MVDPLLKRFDKYLQAAKDIKSDGCTGVPDFEIRICCERHDFHYSDPKCIFTRLAVDKIFFRCIKKKHGTLLAWTYYLGVRAFGWRYWVSQVQPDVLQENRFDVDMFDEEVAEMPTNNSFKIGATDE